MANISLTIKTLDSSNHQFTVSQELTVKELKDHIAEQVSTPSETQRLIYCGRVLQDEKKLTDYDLNGKVVHLVQRAPPSATSNNNNNNPPTGNPRQPGQRSGAIHYHVDRHPLFTQNGGTHSFEIGAAPANAGSSSLLRLNTARRMLQDASQSLGRISTVPGPETQLFAMDNTVEGNYSGAMPFAQAATAAALAAAFSTVQSMGGNNIAFVQGGSGPSVQGSFGFRVQQPQQNESGQEAASGTPSADATTAPTVPPAPSAPTSAPAGESTPQQQPTGGPQGQRNPRITVFADVIEDVERIQQDLRPHLTSVRQLLRDDPTLDTNSLEYRRAQHTYNQVAESMHYLAHAFHAMSDLMVDFGATAPREVRARPYIYQQVAVSAGIPIHASISVETHRAPQQQHQQQHIQQLHQLLLQHQQQQSNQSNQAPPASSTATTTPQVSSQTTTTASSTSAPSSPFPSFQGLLAGGRASRGMGSFTPQDMDHILPGLSNATQGNSTWATPPAWATPAAPASAAPAPAAPTPSQPDQARSSLYTNPLSFERATERPMTGGRAARHNQSANQEVPRLPRSIRLPNGGAFARLPINIQGGGMQGWQPVAMSGNMAPMVFMEVRSGNQNEDNTPPPTVHSPQGIHSEFDDFLPCHSRHLPRSSRGESTSGTSRPTPTVTVPLTTNLRLGRPSQPTAGPNGTAAGGEARPDGGSAPTIQGFDFLNQMMQQLPLFGAATTGTGAGASANINGGGDSSIFNTLFQRVLSEMTGAASGQQTGTTVAHILRGVTDLNQATGESFLFDLFMTVAERLTFHDLIRLFFGNSEVLNQVREPLAPFVRQRILNGEEFEEPAIRHGAMELVQQIMPNLNEALGVSQIRPDVDFVSTMAACIQQRLSDIIQLIGVPGDNPNFGQLMMDTIRQSVTMIIALALACFSDGSASLERVLSLNMRGVADGVHPGMQEWTTRTSIERLRTHTATIDLNQMAPVIEPLVMNNERGRSWLALFNAELEEQRSNRNPTPPSTAAEAPAVPVAPLAQQEELEESMVVDAESDQSMLSLNDSSLVQPPQQPPRRTRLERLRQEVAARPPIEPEPSIDVVLGSQPWHADVPQEWVPVIARDIQRQNRAPPPGPLSDAYLAGIPNKRRKLAQGNRPNVNPQLLIRETMDRALRTANVASAVPEAVVSAASSHAEVGLALLPELRRLGTARLDSDADYNAERFPNAERYFHDASGK